MIAAILSSLKSFDKQNPDYGASVIFELYRSNQNENQQLISVYYLKDSYSENLIKLKLPFCQQSTVCEFTTFMEYISTLIPKNWYKECGETMKQSDW